MSNDTRRFGCATQRWRVLASLTMAIATACGSSEPAPRPGGPGGLPPPAVGLQIASTPIALQPGEERFVCWVVQVPEGDPLSIVSVETQMPADAIHHYQIALKESDEVIESGMDCASTAGGLGMIAVGGPGTPPARYPDGTALVLDPGTSLVYQLHVMNLGRTPVEVPAAHVNLVGAEKDERRERVGILIVNQEEINLPARSRGVSVSGDCGVTEPLEHIFMIWPHMHLLGRRFTADLTRAGGAPSQFLDIEWNFANQILYELDLEAAVGDHLSTTCTYDNPMPKDVHFGMGTQDEMCTGFIYYYPANEMVGFCGEQGGPPDRD